MSWQPSQASVPRTMRSCVAGASRRVGSSASPPVLYSINTENKDFDPSRREGRLHTWSCTSPPLLNQTQKTSLQCLALSRARGRRSSASCILRSRRWRPLKRAWPTRRRRTSPRPAARATLSWAGRPSRETRRLSRAFCSAPPSGCQSHWLREVLPPSPSRCWTGTVSSPAPPPQRPWASPHPTPQTRGRRAVPQRWLPTLRGQPRSPHQRGGAESRRADSLAFSLANCKQCRARRNRHVERSTLWTPGRWKANKPL